MPACNTRVTNYSYNEHTGKFVKLHNKTQLVVSAYVLLLYTALQVLVHVAVKIEREQYHYFTTKKPDINTEH